MKTSTAFEFHLRELMMAARASATLDVDIEPRVHDFLDKYAQTPTALNGWPVIGLLPFRGSYVVLVQRDDPHHPFVVARWSKSCGDSWDQGDYLATLEAGIARLIERYLGLINRAGVKLPGVTEPRKTRDEGIHPDFTRYRIELDVPSGIDPDDLACQAQQFAVDVIDNSEIDGFEAPGPRAIDDIENRVTVECLEG